MCVPIGKLPPLFIPCSTGIRMFAIVLPGAGKSRTRSKRQLENSMEDIWFCTMSEKYYFDVDAVKIRRKVIACTYMQSKRRTERLDGIFLDGNHRITHPSNFWDDVTVPFWSMPENTDHPTQKPEKLIAKLILASSAPGAIIFDPCCGSGTTSVVAKKLGRHFVGVEMDELYACLTVKRFELANDDNRIQGFSDGVFWERNSAPK